MPNPIIDTINIDGTTYDIADSQARTIDPSMYIASYGISTYAEVLAAFQAKKIVYCRTSTNSNPATGNQLRMAFLAYVNDPTTPTEFEFQYYRSVSSHTDAQQGDQVFVYKLNKTSGWSVTTRNTFTKIASGTGLTGSYASGTLTLSSTTYTLSMSNNRITLTPSSGTATYVDLPVYSGGYI